MSDRKAEYRPDPEPQWVKETMVEDYKARADANGKTPSTSDIERIVVEDLRLSDAVDRDTVKRIPLKPKERAPGPSKKVANLATSLGWQVYKRSPKDRAAKQSHAAFLSRPMKTEKQLKALERMTLLLQQGSPVRLSKTADFVGGVLGNDVVSLLTNLKEQRGPFVGKSAKDCERIFWRGLEDICDRSTGKHGAWWVK